MHEQPHVSFHDGHRIPQLGYGVWQVDPEAAVECVRTAIEVGYRSIDTAKIYANEQGVGAGIRASGIDRDELFVTTKLWNDAHERDAAFAACDTSLELLGLEAVDLYLIHWPSPAQGDFLTAWRSLLELRARGKARSVGVCNFDIEHLETLRTEVGELPVIDQVELHPYFQQAPLRAWCADAGVAVEAWSPLGQGGELLQDPQLVELASEHGRTVAQVVLRWHLQLGNVVIPKSASPSRIAENFAVFDFELTDGDMARIAALDRPDGRLGPDPSTASF